MVIFQIWGYGLDSNNARRLSDVLKEVIPKYYQKEGVSIEVVPSECTSLETEKRAPYIKILVDPKEVSKIKKVIQILCKRKFVVRLGFDKEFYKKPKSEK